MKILLILLAIKCLMIMIAKADETESAAIQKIRNRMGAYLVSFIPWKFLKQDKFPGDPNISEEPKKERVIAILTGRGWTLKTIN